MARFHEGRLTTKTLTLKEAWLSVLSAVEDVLNYVQFVGRGLDEDARKIQSLGNADIWKQIYKGFESVGLTDPSIRSIAPHENEQYGPAMPADMLAEKQALPVLDIKADTSHALPSLTPDSSKGSTKEKTDQVETYIQSLQKAAAAEEAEAKTLGMSNKAKQEAIDLAKAQEAALLSPGIN